MNFHEIEEYPYFVDQIIYWLKKIDDNLNECKRISLICVAIIHIL